MKSKLAAWAWGVTGGEIDVAREQLPFLHYIHYPGTYDFAQRGDIAFVNSAQDADEAVNRAEYWRHAIVGDERNVDGPSGTYETPEAYIDRAMPIFEILEENGIPWHFKGLASPGGKFDYDYLYAMLRIHTERGWPTITQIPRFAANGRTYRLPEHLRAIDTINAARWSITSLPLRPNWWPLKYNSVLSWLFKQELFGPDFTRVMDELYKRKNVDTIGIWCLKTKKLGDGYYQGWHGIFNRHGELTRVGRELHRWAERNLK